MIASESMTRTYLANYANTDTNANTIGLDGQQDEEAGKATKASVQVSAGGAGSSHDHAHICIAVQDAANWADMPLGATLRDQVLAYMFELACVTHSVLIGEACAGWESAAREPTCHAPPSHAGPTARHG